MLFKLFSTSLQEYEEQAGIALSKHPTAERLRYCYSAKSVTAILQEQVPACSGFGGTDRITKSTPLHLASREGHLVVASFLVDDGADAHAHHMGSIAPLNLTSREGQTGSRSLPYRSRR